MTRIAMWSGPRNLSTAMMRSWENRPDTAVMDEPLYAAYLATTGVEHPATEEIIAAGRATGTSDFAGAIAACLAPLPPGATISYQKHMAHHLPVGDDGLDLSWIDGLRNCLLVRDPRRVLASYTKVREAVTLEDIGMPQQMALLPHCELVIDATDFLTDPAGYQREICRHLEVPATDDVLATMLSWPGGSRTSDGVWADHWYASVRASTSFGPVPVDPPPDLPGHLHAVAEAALEIYADLSTDALRLVR